MAGADGRALGLPTEAEYTAAYCRHTGRVDIPNLDFYLAFNMFRLAAIIHGIKGRLLQSQSAQIGDASYRYAVVEADEIKLWSESEGRSGFQFHFGIGIFR